MVTRGKQPAPTDLAYIAAMIDGEGTVGIYRKYPQKPTHKMRYLERVAISNSCTEVLDYIQQFFPGCVAKNKRYSDLHKPMFRLEYHVLRVRPILEACLPYMIIKKKQAEMVLAYRDNIVIDQFHNLPQKELEKREWYYQELKKLNKTGVQPQRLIGTTAKAEVIVRSA